MYNPAMNHDQLRKDLSANPGLANTYSSDFGPYKGMMAGGPANPGPSGTTGATDFAKPSMYNPTLNHDQLRRDLEANPGLANTYSSDSGSYAWMMGGKPRPAKKVPGLFDAPPAKPSMYNPALNHDQLRKDLAANPGLANTYSSDSGSYAGMMGGGRKI